MAIFDIIVTAASALAFLSVTILLIISIFDREDSSIFDWQPDISEP